MHAVTENSVACETLVLKTLAFRANFVKLLRDVKLTEKDVRLLQQLYYDVESTVILCCDWEAFE